MNRWPNMDTSTGTKPGVSPLNPSSVQKLKWKLEHAERDHLASFQSGWGDTGTSLHLGLPDRQTGGAPHGELGTLREGGLSLWLGPVG